MPNLRRGFFRLWILVAVLWVGPATYLNLDALGLRAFGPDVEITAGPDDYDGMPLNRFYDALKKADAAGNAEDARALADEIIRMRGEALERARGRLKAAQSDKRLNALLIVFVPPLALLILGASFGWAFRGFAKR